MASVMNTPVTTSQPRKIGWFDSRVVGDEAVAISERYDRASAVSKADGQQSKMSRTTATTARVVGRDNDSTGPRPPLSNRWWNESPSTRSPAT